MCSEWFELVEQAKLSNEQTEQLTVAAQAQFKVIIYSGQAPKCSDWVCGD